MKTIVLLFLASISTLLAVPQHQVMDMRLTPVGDADITLTMNFDAQAWQMWSSTIGQNPSVMKRELQRMFSTTTLSEFEMDRNDLERRVTVSLHAVGLARYLGDGRWEADIEAAADPSTSVSGRKISDTTYLTTSTTSAPGQGVILQQEITLHLPEGAGDLTESRSETGTDLLRYQLPPAETTNPSKTTFLASGSACALAGAICFLLGGRRSE